MNLIALASIVILVILVALIVFIAFMRRRINPNHFKKQWQDLQSFLKSKETWPIALITADKLLDEALKKRRMKGKSMGERLVAAQRELSDNDGVWYAHNLAKKLIDETISGLKQPEIKKSLVGIRQALRDLGVLSDK